MSFNKGKRETFPTRRGGLVALAAFAAILYATPVSAQIINGSFESGDFTGFTRSGFIIPAGGPGTGGPNFTTFRTASAAGTPRQDSNAVTAAQSGGTFDGNGAAGPAILPTNGGFLAFVSNLTSAGNQSLTGSSLSQTFTLPVGVTSLSFDVAFLNNDDAADLSSFNDFGGVSLTQGTTILAEYNLDLDPGSGAQVHVSPGAARGGFENSTPWATGSFNVSGLSGQSVTLTAYSLQYGEDNTIESRLLVDNIRLAGSVTVPEPGSGALACVALIPIGFFLRRWRERHLSHRREEPRLG